MAPRPPASTTLPTTAWRCTLLALALFGLVLPWWHYLPYFVQGGSAAFLGFWGAATANPVATGITLDVYLAAASFALWVLHERRVRWPWLVALACFAIGLAVVLPLYLLLRERSAPLPLSR
jgi:hypothetical protein